jgi:uncharacterized protein
MRHWLVMVCLLLGSTLAQTAPSEGQVKTYRGLLAAAASGDVKTIQSLIQSGSQPEVRDDQERTPLLVAAHFGHLEAARALLASKANPNAFDWQRYDLITIAAVRNDVPMLRLGLQAGASAKNITSPYDGTALIAAAHLGHVQVVKLLLEADAPRDHINNLGWTALLEAIILGDGGSRHTEVVRLLLAAGANWRIADRNGVSPLEHAKQRGYIQMQKLLEGVAKSP